MGNIFLGIYLDVGCLADHADFGSLPDDLWSKLGDSAANIAMENHEYGVPPAHYDRWPILKHSYRILSTTVDRSDI